MRVSSYSFVVGVLARRSIKNPGRRTEKNAKDNAASAVETPVFTVMNWYAENIVTGRWKRESTRTRFPSSRLVWNELRSERSHHRRRNKGYEWPKVFNERLSSPVTSRTSLLADVPPDCRGLRLLVAELENVAPVGSMEDGLRENIQSIDHTNTLSTIVPARMARNKMRHVRNKLRGSMPTLHAKASMPL